VGEYRPESQSGRNVPKTPVTPGGITDRLLSDYSEHVRRHVGRFGPEFDATRRGSCPRFLRRHQDKLLFGSDCSDREAQWPGLPGLENHAAIRRLHGRNGRGARSSATTPRSSEDSRFSAVPAWKRHKPAGTSASPCGQKPLGPQQYTKSGSSPQVVYSWRNGGSPYGGVCLLD